MENITMSILSNRHDILVLFDVQNGNPNGDPDAGNLPRIDPTTNKGLVSDVCLKRKVRNFVTQFCRDADGKPLPGLDILVRQGAVINRQIDRAVEHSKQKLGTKAADSQKAEEAMKWLCKEFYDVRAFGAVLSTGKKGDIMTGSAFGQVRGPAQFTFARSKHAITPLEISITRCAVTKEEDIAKERTMGNKHIIPYALYEAKAYISPVFAERTGFSEADLKILFEALGQLFTHDQSAARPEMNVRAIYDFEHVGTQNGNNAEQNKREARLGCYHAYKLFEGIRISPKNGKELPESFTDFVISDDWKDKDGFVVPGVKLNRLLDPNS
jgi:CRISPR-associated protein Csd2